MAPFNVLIVGASIAGPTTAYWFAKTGAIVTIIERFPSIRTGGQNIDIRTAGVTVMRKMPGMEAAVRAKILDMEGLAFVRDDGRPYGVIRPTGDPERQTLISEYEIFRGDLNRVLYDLTSENERIRYVFGEKIASMQQDENVDGPITVEFANGKLPTSTYDLVVACDGATSRTRAMGLECGVRTHIHPTNCWAAYFSIKRPLLKGSKVGDRVAQASSAVGGRSMALGPDHSADVTRVGLMSMHSSGDHDATLGFREASKKGDEELKRFVAKHYEGAGWRSEDILKGLVESDDFYGSEVVQVKVPSLSKGRFVLVGDAGYAPGFTGTGTTLAIAGAYVLAGETGKHQDDIAAGLKGYEEVMRPIINDLQRQPPFITTIMAPQTVWGIWVRNQLFSFVANIYEFVAWTGILQLLQSRFAGAFANSDKYKLPDYQWVV